MSTLVTATAVASAWIACADGDLSSVNANVNVATRNDPSMLVFDQWVDVACREVGALGYIDSARVRLMSIRSRGQAAADATGTFMPKSIKAGRMHLEWQSDAGTGKNLWIEFDAHALVWVYGSDFAPGYQLQSDDLQPRKKDVSNYLGVDAPAGEAAIGLSTGRYVREGEVVMDNDLREPALVGRLSRVRAVLISDGIQIQTSGIAQSVGWRIGDSLQLKLEDSQKLLTGKVAGIGVVYVEI